MKPDHERVSKLLLDTVMLLCKNGLTYETELKIQGLLAITLDSSEVFVVHINESFGGATGSTAVSQNDRDCVTLSSDAEQPPPRKRHAPAQEVVDLTRLVETPDIRPSRLALPPSSAHADNQRRQRIGAQVPPQQRIQTQLMPSPINSLSDAAARMLPPQAVPSAVPRHDGALYPLPAAPPARGGVMNATGSERFQNVNNQNLRQRHPNYPQMNASLREEEAARQRQQRLSLENKRLAAAQMAAIQQRNIGQSPAQGSMHQSSAYGVSGSMPMTQSNYTMMSLRHRNPAAMPSLHHPQQTPVGSGSSLSYQYQYPVNHPYEGPSRMVQHTSIMPNALPNLPLLCERPRCVESSNPVQQLMLDYERLGQQHQSNVLGPTMSVPSSFLHMSAMSGSNYSSSQAQRDHPTLSLPGTDSEQRRSSTHVNPELSLPSDSRVIAKEYLTSPNIPVRKSPRVRVEHIDLSDDVDDDDLQQTLQSDISADLVPTSSIIIQPDDFDVALDAAASNAISQFESSVSTSHMANTDEAAACIQQSGEKTDSNPEYVTMDNVQEIAPLVVLSEMSQFDLPTDAATDGHSQSPDGRVPAVLSDSGRSTGSERMDCMEESLAAQLDGCFDEHDPEHSNGFPNSTTSHFLSEHISDLQ